MHSHPSHIKCKTCGKNITDTSSDRTTAILQKFLNENTHFTDALYPEDRVCYACHRSHLVLVKHHIKETVQSIDTDLKDLISRNKHSSPHIEEIGTYDSALQYVVKLLA